MAWGKSNKGNSYDVLDKILSDAQIPARQGNADIWVTDPNHPSGGYAVTPEQWETLQRSVDDIERQLRG